MKRLIISALAFATYAGSVWAAAWMIQRWGQAPVWPGVEAPAGVYAAGVAFTARDILHRYAGGWWALAAVALGVGLAYLFADPMLAMASAWAFAAGAVLDTVVFALLRRHFLAAVLVSNVVGLGLDSLVFLERAFGSLAFFWPQVLGKGLMTLAAVGVILAWRKVAARRAA